MSYRLPPYPKAILGRGTFSLVLEATDGDGNLVAVKKSRASKAVKRTYLRHEARILRMLHGQSSIPAVYAYGRFDHFEYMAIELLGPSVAEMKKRDAALSEGTVIRIGIQMLAALRHIHSLGIVHRDIKPENILCAREDPSTIKIIDFGISKPFRCDTPHQYNPLANRRMIVGTLYWASLNSHNGIDLSPRDDLESLAYIILYLFCGTLPWKPRPNEEPQLRSQEIVRLMKMQYPLSVESYNFQPVEFAQLLQVSRSLDFGQLQDKVYARIVALFECLAERDGCSLLGPLDWTSDHAYPPVELDEPNVSIDSEEDDPDSSDGENSYFGWDIDAWDYRPKERDRDLTLPEEGLKERLDRDVNDITQIVINQQGP